MSSLTENSGGDGGDCLPPRPIHLTLRGDAADDLRFLIAEGEAHRGEVVTAEKAAGAALRAVALAVASGVVFTTTENGR